MNTADNIAHWNQRAALGERAGTQDLILKQLEQVAILGHIPEDAELVLEVGCGLGETAAMVSKRVKHVFAIDSSPEMIYQAHYAKTRKNVTLSVGDVHDPPNYQFDVVYSQRCLINLPNWAAQKQAIEAIARVLRPRGTFLMCEHSAEGLSYINFIREQWKRPAIPQPWHNSYIPDEMLEAEYGSRWWHRLPIARAWAPSLRLKKVVPFSATYYFLSRILNDKLAEAEGLQPAYDAKINQLALRLPYSCADARLSQGRLWIWEKV